MQILTRTRAKNAESAQQRTKVFQCFLWFSGEQQRIWDSVPWPVLRKTLSGPRLRWCGGCEGGVCGRNTKCPPPPRLRPIWVIKAFMSLNCWCFRNLCSNDTTHLRYEHHFKRWKFTSGKKEKSLTNMNTQVVQWQTFLLQFVQSKYLWKN